MGQLYVPFAGFPGKASWTLRRSFCSELCHATGEWAFKCKPARPQCCVIPIALVGHPEQTPPAQLLDILNHRHAQPIFWRIGGDAVDFVAQARIVKGEQVGVPAHVFAVLGVCELTTGI